MASTSIDSIPYTSLATFLSLHLCSNNNNNNNNRIFNTTNKIICLLSGMNLKVKGGFGGS